VSSFEGSITLSSWDHSQGCVKVTNGDEVCGAFISEGGGSNGPFATGTKVIGSLGTLDVNGNGRRVILLNVAG
jgi:hypothetical protein